MSAVIEKHDFAEAPSPPDEAELYEQAQIAAELAAKRMAHHRRVVYWRYGALAFIVFVFTGFTMGLPILGGHQGAPVWWRIGYLLVLQLLLVLLFRFGATLLIAMGLWLLCCSALYYGGAALGLFTLAKFAGVCFVIFAVCGIGVGYGIGRVEDYE